MSVEVGEKRNFAADLTMPWLSARCFICLCDVSISTQLMVASPEAHRVMHEFLSSVLASTVLRNFGGRNSTNFQYFSMTLSGFQA